MTGRERESPATEAKVKAWGEWLIDEGGACGLRPPTDDLRARAVGLASYYRSLGIHGRQLYGAVGIH
eukprot:6155287-Pyramimonas_sp.AAC.1